MDIILSYKIKNSDFIEVLRLTAEEYFDKIQEHENFENDAIAKYDKEQYYILDFNPDISLDELEYTTVELTNSNKSDFVTRTNYYGNDTTVIYRKDKNGFELIVQSIRVATNCIVITRLERPNSFSEWTNINLNIGLNYNQVDNGKEKWFSSKNGEFINKPII